MDTQPEKQSQSFTKTLMIGVFALILVSAVGYGGYRLWQNRESTTQPNNKTPTSSANPYLYNQVYGQKTADPNWYLLTDPRYLFTLEFPSYWSIREYNNTPEEFKEWNHAINFNLPKDESGISYPVVDLYVWDNTENLSFMEWAGMYVEKVTGSSRYVPASPNARIAGEDTLFYLEPREQTWGGVYALLEHESKVYLFEYDGINNGADYPTFVHMLETFEFEGKETEDQLLEINIDDFKPKILQ